MPPGHRAHKSSQHLHRGGPGEGASRALLKSPSQEVVLKEMCLYGLQAHRAGESGSAARSGRYSSRPPAYPPLYVRASKLQKGEGNLEHATHKNYFEGTTLGHLES